MILQKRLERLHQLWDLLFAKASKHPQSSWSYNDSDAFSCATRASSCIKHSSCSNSSVNAMKCSSQWLFTNSSLNCSCACSWIRDKKNFVTAEDAASDLEHVEVCCFYCLFLSEINVFLQVLQRKFSEYIKELDNSQVRKLVAPNNLAVSSQVKTSLIWARIHPTVLHAQLLDYDFR